MHLWNWALIDWLKQELKDEISVSRWRQSWEHCAPHSLGCVRGIQMGRDTGMAATSTWISQTKRKVNSVCHTQPCPRAVTNSDHQSSFPMTQELPWCSLIPITVGIPSLHGWDCRRGSAPPTAPPCRRAPPSQGTATTLHWLSCAANPRQQDAQGCSEGDGEKYIPTWNRFQM